KEAYTRSLWAVRSFVKQPHPGSDALLETKGLGASYGRLKVLDDVSLTLERGRTVAVVGESGSGKSTLARVVTGLLRPTDGTVTFAGEVLAPSAKDRSRRQLQALQIIHQNPDASLNPAHTVREVVGRPLELFFGLRGSERDSRVLEILEQVELEPKHLNRLP